MVILAPLNVIAFMNTQNTSEENRKEVAIKTLALIGLVAIVVVALWALIQAVRFAPVAFTSLASIADSLYNQEERLVVDANKNVVNAGEPLYITWSDVERAGTYSFTYECVDGVSAEARNQSGDIVSLSCDTPFELNSDTFELEMIFESEKSRFVDVPYSVTFNREGEDDATHRDGGLMTVVNAAIAQSQEVEEANDDDPADDTTEDADDETTDSAVAGAQAPTTGGTTRTIPVTTTSYPVSDPNGDVDLVVTYLGLGSLDSDNEFTPRGELDNDRRGAVRFEVKNIGTKTSDTWTIEAELPTSPGTTYDSPTQEELRPNERSVVTIGFDALGEARNDTVEVQIETDEDVNQNNNDFSWSVKIVD